MARVDYLGAKFEANASIATNRGATSASAGASGSLVAMGGHVFASRRIYDGFAVVDTNGISHVPIKRENNLVGTTDDNGVMLVTQLGAYRNNKISIDPLDLPAQLRVPKTDQNIVPTDRAGQLVKFDIERIRSASVKLVDLDGQPLALGSRAVVSFIKDEKDTARPQKQDTVSIVGYEGTTYFESLDEHNRIEVYMPSGRTCVATVDWPNTSTVNEIPVIGPITCQRGK